MTTEAIFESGMVFGPYAPGQCFYLEHSRLYQRLQDQVKIAEFALAHNNAIYVVEAKSSSPHPGNRLHYDEFITEIYTKLLNSLLLLLGVLIHRHQDKHNEFPPHWKEFDLAQINFKLMLVVNGHKDEWLVPLQDDLRTRFYAICRSFALSADSVVVINEVMAQKIGLIKS